MMPPDHPRLFERSAERACQAGGDDDVRPHGSGKRLARSPFPLLVPAVNLRRKAKKPLDAKATRDVVSDYLAWQVVVNGGYSILEALDLEAKYQISFWDALIVEAAHVFRC